MFEMSLGFLGLRNGMDSGPSVVGRSGHVWDTSLAFPGQWNWIPLQWGTRDMSWDVQDPMDEVLYSVGLHRKHPTIIL